MKSISKRAIALNGGAALLIVLGIAAYQIGFGVGHTKAAANGHAHAHPYMKGVLPTHGKNSLQNITLAGDDGDTNADPGTNLSALCQSYLGSPNVNPYANPAPNVDMIHGDTAVVNGSQKGCGAAQNETSIAVNPHNPNDLVGGTNDYRLFNSREGRHDGSGWYYTSTNGGTTWTNNVLPGLTYQTGATGALSDMDSAGDPAIAFGANNTVYYSNLVFSRLNNGSGVTVNVSHDGGLTFGAPITIHTDGVDAAGNAIDTNYFNDKNWIAADPNTGDVIVTWTHFTYDANGNYLESPIVRSVSHDFGATWSAMDFVSTSLEHGATGGLVPFNQGSNPVFGRHGEIYVAYEGVSCVSLACDQAQDHDNVAVATSTDGGQTFSNAEVAVNYDFPRNPDVGRSTLTGENFRINSFPQMTVDGQTGRLYITWADNRNGAYDSNGNSVKTNGDVLVVTSGNGQQWTQEYTIGSAADEVYPAIAANNGRVVVSYYTRNFDPNGIKLDYAYSEATGLGNLNHTTVTRITGQSENPQVQFISIGAVSHQVLQGSFIGDYTAVAMGSDGVAHPMWTDFRGDPNAAPTSVAYDPNQDAYTQAISSR